MRVIKFVTNISDNESAEKIKEQLAGMPGIMDCIIDLNNPGKILTVKALNINSEIVSRVISGTGFKCQEIIPRWKKLTKRLLTRSCCD